jgi:hypothetical protein
MLNPEVGENLSDFYFPDRPKKHSARTDEEAAQHYAVVELIVIWSYSKSRAWKRVFGCSNGRQGGEIFRNYPHAVEYANSLREWAHRATGIQAWQIVQELRAIAFGRPDSVMEWDVQGARLVPSDQMDPMEMAQIASITSTEKIAEDGAVTVTTKATFHNKLQALKLLAEMGGLTGEFNGAIRTLSTYGLIVKESADGRYYIEDAQAMQGANGGGSVGAGGGSGSTVEVKAIGGEG